MGIQMSRQLEKRRRDGVESSYYASCKVPIIIIPLGHTNDDVDEYVGETLWIMCIRIERIR